MEKAVNRTSYTVGTLLTSEGRTWLGPLLAMSLLALATGCGDNPTSELRKGALNSRWEGGNETTFHFVHVEIDHLDGAFGSVEIGNYGYVFLWNDMPETQKEGLIYASVSVKGAEITSLTPRWYIPTTMMFEILDVVFPHTWAAFLTFSLKWIAIGAVLVAAIGYSVISLEERWPEGIGNTVAEWIRSKRTPGGEVVADSQIDMPRELHPFFRFEKLSSRQLVGLVASSLCLVLGCGAMLWVGTDLSTRDYITGWSGILFFGFGFVVGGIGLVGRLQHRHEFVKQPHE